MIPGVGGTVASFLAYGHAVQSAGDSRTSFGHGDIRGVIAPEAANDAKDGASLIPTLAFGVPGSLATAVLLATLILHGLVPGKELITSQLGLVFALIWVLTLSSWLTSVVGILAADHLTRLTVIRTQLLVPIILMVAALGAFVNQGRIQDVVVALAFGILGYFMKRYDWPRISLVIALVLGPLFETNLHLTLRLQDLGRINVLTRPGSLTLILLIALSLLMPLWRQRRSATA
jgi:putative tricarboxylic transport membrane protein